MKVKFKKVENIILMLLILILIASMLIIRDGNKFIIIQISILILTITYIIIKRIKKEPMKIIKNKMDIFVIIFILSSFIPIIFNNYTSFNTSLTVSLNYICLFFWYILVSNLLNKEKVDYINILIIILAIVLVILGLENLTTNKLLPLLGIDNISNGEDRLVSIIGNPNVLATFLAFSFFIILHKIINTIKIEQKIILNIANVICVIGIILTYSKSIYILMPIAIIIYMIIVKDKVKEIYINIIIYLFLALSYIMIFNKLLAIENYIFIWIYLIFILLLDVLLNILMFKIKSKIEKIKIIHIFIISMIIILLGIVWVVVELNNIMPYEVFNNRNTIDYASKKINNIKGNEKYIFSFEIYSEVYENIEDMYEINIIERDKRNYEIKNTSFTFGNFEGTKELEIITDENTIEFKIEFKARYQYLDRNLIINKLIINDKQIPLQYKNLSIKIVDKIKDISINYKTAQERIEFIKDALKISKDNLLIGIGGENWQYRYGEVQEYDYTSSDIHSYPIQILLEFGIIGFISLILIYSYVIKNRDKKFLGIKIGFIIIILHSAIDSDMKFPFMQMIVYTYLGIFSMLNYEKEKNKIAYMDIISIVIAIIVMYFLCNSTPYKEIGILESQKIGLNINSSEYKQYAGEIARKYEDIIIKERNDLIGNYVSILKSYLESEQTDKIEEYYKKIKEYKNKSKYKTDKIVEKSNGITVIIQTMEDKENPELFKWITKFAKIQIDEYDNTKQELKHAIENKFEKIDENLEYASLEQNYIYAKEVYEKYFLGVAIINQSDKEINQNILNNNIDLQEKNILIYHTHTTEAYNPNNEYEEIEHKKTLNENYNVLKIGDILEGVLKNDGYKVTHLREYNDILGVNGAYNNSEQVVKEYLKKENAQIIFDIHRDAGIGNTVIIDNKENAKLRFVIASGYKNWEQRLNWAIKIQKKADEIYPGLFKPILIYNNTYNQDLGEYATIIEVGDDENTIEEAENSILLFANILKEILN